MRKYTVDTNLWIGAFADASAEAELATFLEHAAPRTHLHAVVMQELGAGVSTMRQVHALESAVFDPFERRKRVFGPQSMPSRSAAGCLPRCGVRTEITSDNAHVRSSTTF